MFNLAIDWELYRGANPVRKGALRSVQDNNAAKPVSKPLTLVVESQLYTTGALVSFYAYTIGKLPNHKGR
jgi:hypothetical protein